MSEKTLDNIIRQLRQAENYLLYAEDMADTLLMNHTVASEIHTQAYDVKRYREFLDEQYRPVHFGKLKRRQHYGSGRSNKTM